MICHGKRLNPDSSEYSMAAGQRICAIERGTTANGEIEPKAMSRRRQPIWAGRVTAATGLLALATIVACAPPPTFRRSALVPSPTGEPLATPMTSGAELSGTVSHTDTASDPIPNLGDPAVHVARTQIEGHLRAALGEHFALGGQLYFSHASFSHPSTFGTPPVQGNDIWGGSTVWGLGPVASFQLTPKGSMLGFTAVTAFNLVNVPWTTWRRTSPAAVGDSWAFDPADHEVDDTGTDFILLYRFSTALTIAPDDRFTLFVGVSAQNAAINIGFDDQERDGSTVTASEHGIVPFVGGQFRAGGALLGVQYYLPLGYSHLDGWWPIERNLGGLAITLGGEL